ncbi:MAG: GntR family transcriptional regulator [Puniceicoccaceae bacterium]|nr:GntR family transcriptional regulator [Puniceicoccaceae bacterium]|tara:strand:+ start:14939 stop:15811 length:873 start_codon:yes stop_codon:yes gene_type:complete
MANIGKYNTLTVLEKSDHGLYLDGGAHEKILMPTRYVTPEMTIGSEVEVFVYNDSEDRLVATTETPYAQAGEFAYLEVISVHPTAGAFLDWGLSKDLLLPYREQGNTLFTEGDGAIVAVYVDEYTNRVVASTRLHNHLPPEKPPYEVGDAVQVLIYGDSPLGFKSIIDKRYRGLLYHEETSDQLEPGDQFTGYIKKVHNDGKIDLRRDPSGYGRVDGVSKVILEKLEAAGGALPFNDKSTPEDIRATFDTSKKAFKQGIGRLYKQRLILITESGIERVQEVQETQESTTR